MIRYVIAESEIDLVTDGTDGRNRTFSDRTNQMLIIKRPKILEASASAGKNHDIHTFERLCFLKRGHEGAGRIRPLNDCRNNDDVMPERPPLHHV